MPTSVLDGGKPTKLQISFQSRRHKVRHRVSRAGQHKTRHKSPSFFWMGPHDLP